MRKFLENNFNGMVAEARMRWYKHGETAWRNGGIKCEDIFSKFGVLNKKKEENRVKLELIWVKVGQLEWLIVIYGALQNKALGDFWGFLLPNDIWFF